MPIYSTTYWVDTEPLRIPSRPTKKLPNSQRILRLVTSDKWGTCGMFRPCLIHPVAPLLSLFAPLFRPFRSPVRGLRNAVTERGNPLTFLVFCSGFAFHARTAEDFLPCYSAKTGERRSSRSVARRRIMVPGSPPCSLLARSLRGRSASLRTVADDATDLHRKWLIWRGLLVMRPTISGVRPIFLPALRERGQGGGPLARPAPRRDRGHGCSRHSRASAPGTAGPCGPFRGSRGRRFENLCNWITPSFAGATGNKLITSHLR
jgi:hypothetical protein